MSWKETLDESGKKEVEQLEAKIAESTQKLSNAGQELASNRKDKQEIEAERDSLKIKLAEAEEKAREGNPTGGLTEADVRKILGEQDEKTAVQNRESAEARFKAAHKEFAADADPSGVKFSAVKGKLARFNLSGLKTVEEFTSVYEEAYTLVNPARAADDEGSYSPYAESPSDTGNSPREIDTDNLSPKEKKLIARLGWDKERYLKQKKARPTYVRTLLDQME